jgi:hypothetical protein
MKTSNVTKQNKSIFQFIHLACIERRGIISNRTSWRRLQEKAKTMLKRIWTRAFLFVDELLPSTS